MDLVPEHGGLTVFGTNGCSRTAFALLGVECLRQLLVDRKR